jgi:hypothetical protein
VNFYLLEQSNFFHGHQITPIHTGESYTTVVLEPIDLAVLKLDRNEYTTLADAMENGQRSLMQYLAEQAVDLAMDEITARQHNRD